MVYLIEGRSGSGKTQYAVNILGELSLKGESKLLYLIPEQSSFESETAFLRKLGAVNARNVNVMSFTRLYDMVMRQTGMIHGTPIDDGVRRVLMSVAVESCTDNLEIYQKQARSQRLTELMINTVKEFKMCGISSHDLREAAAKTKGSDLSKKLVETALITDTYNAYIDRSYVDPLDNNSRLEKRLEKVNFFDGYTVVVDDFSGFTAEEQKILKLIMSQCKDFYITLCKNPDSDEELFFTVNRTKTTILRIAKELGLRVGSPVRLRECFRIQSRELSLVEENIYRVGNTVSFDGNAEHDVMIGEASDIFEECEYIAERISSLALSGECRYRDIAVVYRSAEKYAGIIDNAFDRHNIPYFMSKPEPIDNKPLVVLVLSAFEYVINPASCDSLLNIGKCGLTGFNEYDIALLENYIFTWGINGRSFNEPFTANPNGYTSKSESDSTQTLERINEVRNNLITPLLDFASKLENAKTKDISAAVYELLIDYGVSERLKKDNDGSDEYLVEEVRLWDILTYILNKMYLSLDEREITVKRYYDLLKLMISSCDISNIPQTLDQVLIGTANSVRLNSPYAVFAVGAVNGEFPHNPVASGVFNDAERQRLISLNLPMYDAVAELYLQEKFLVYNAVSAARNKLCVTYPTGDMCGGILKESSIVTEIKRILPNAEQVNISAVQDIDRIQNERSAFSRCAKGFKLNDPLSEALKEYFKSDERYKGTFQAMKRAEEGKDFRLESRQTAKALFGDDKVLSASQIEKFYTCRFQYFCAYGLRLKERKKAELGAAEYGNLIHYLLENVMKEYKLNGYSPLSDERMSELLDELLQKYISEFMGGEEDKSDRFMYLYNRLKHSTLALMNHLSEELMQSQFKPVDFELAINGKGDGISDYKLIDENGSTVSVRGLVDRVDIMKTDKVSYIRIVDYKTGKKQFNLADVLYGLNMQMLIYLSAIMKNGSSRYGKELRPSGILYMPSTVTSVSVKPYAEKEEILKEHDKALKMNGLLLDELQVLRGMEEKLEGRFIPAVADKSGKIKSSSTEYLVSLKQMNMIFDKAEKKITQMSEQLDEGRIEAVPTGNEAHNPCRWCLYRDICCHEQSDKMNCLVGMKKEEILEAMQNDAFGEEK